LIKEKLVYQIRKFFQFRDHIIHFILMKKKKISHNSTTLIFSAPNRLCDYRARSFSDKEPETLEWIESIDEGSVFWDIGANVGIYSIYAAKRKKAQVWAFEPSVFNLEFLARNINLNNLQNQIRILPVALNDGVGFNLMKHSTTTWGGALSVFDKDFGQDGKKLADVFSYTTLGVSMDFAVRNLNVPLPDYIKMDVDGIEHMILAGGVESLKHTKEILVEINEDFEDQKNKCDEILNRCGFELHKRGAYPLPTIRIGNQIWKNKTCLDNTKEKKGEPCQEIA